MSLILSFLVPLLIGFFLISLLWPSQGPVRSQLLIKSSLALGLGLGVSSCTFFLWSVVFYPSSAGFPIVEAALGIVLTVVFSCVRRTRKDSATSPFGPISNLKTHWILSTCFYISLLAAVVALILSSIKNPHGGWDAWTIWNMRARFIFRGGDYWTDAFSGLLYWSHPDYPLMVPGLIARGWVYVGQETIIVPILVSMLFTLAIVGLLSSSVTILRGKSQGLLAGLTLLGTPLFIEQGTSQLADIPLSFFFLATIVLFRLQEKLVENNRRFLFLAGMAAGLSAWTKNEGLLFLAAVLASRLTIMVPVKESRVFLRQVFSFTAGLVPILATILYFKIQLAPPNDLFSIHGLQAGLGRLTEGSRYWQVSKALVEEMIYFGNWVFSLPLLLALYLAVVGIKLEGKDRLGIATSMLMLCLVLVGYFFVYVASPYDLQWHLATSLRRLLLQLWPSVLFTFFLLANTPEQTLREK